MKHYIFLEKGLSENQIKFLSLLEDAFFNEEVEIVHENNGGC